MSAIFVNEGRKAALDEYIATFAASLRVGLYTAPNPATLATALAGVTPATFAGYAAQVPVFGAAAIDGNGNALAAGGTLTFTAGAVAGAETILGYYLWNNATAKLIFIEPYSAPIVINAAGQFITATPNWYRGQLTPPL